MAPRKKTEEGGGQKRERLLEGKIERQWEGKDGEFVSSICRK